METVLITAIGSASADITIKSLHQNGYRVIGTDIYPGNWLADSKSVDCFAQVPSTTDSKKYIHRLLDICEKESVQYIIPLTDLEVDVLNMNRHPFDEREIKLCISDRHIIPLCRNKRNASRLIQKKTSCCVIPEIKKEMVTSWTQFPVICKKIDGRSSNGMNIFLSKKELQCFIEENGIQDYVIQPFLDGKIITADILRDKKYKECVILTREELLRTTNGLGTTVRIFHEQALEDMCIQMAEALDIQGCVNFEFLETVQGKRYFLECNPRFSGGLEFSVLSGYDFVINHLRYFQGKRIDKQIIPDEQIISRKYEEYVMWKKIN